MNKMTVVTRETAFSGPPDSWVPDLETVTHVGPNLFPGDCRFSSFLVRTFVKHLYPLVNQHGNGKSQFLMGKSTINSHFQ